MTNLSKGLREKLAGETEYTVLKPVEILTSEIDGTQKYLFESERRERDRERPDEISPRKFCVHFFSGGLSYGLPLLRLHDLGGMKRDLTAIGDAGADLPRSRRSTGERVSNVVVMGTGEPLDNYDNVSEFIGLLTDENGLTYQPEKRHRIHLRHRTEDPAAGRRGASDHAGALPSCVEPGETGKT